MAGPGAEVDAETVVANLREPVVAVDGTDEIAFANDRFLDVTQFSREALFGADFERFERIVEDGFTTLRRAVETVEAGESDEERVELSMCHPEDAPVKRRLPAEARITPLTDGDETVGVLVTLRDISDRIEHRQELNRQNERLEEFARVVSHDLRNPLNVAKGELGYVREHRDDEHLRKVDCALDRMNTLISETLSLARQGKTVGDPTPVELPSLLETCWEHVETGDATLEVDDEFTVIADPKRLSTLFENLFHNAVAHGDADVITVGRLADDGFYVADNGTGFAEDAYQEYFEPGHTGVNGGTGFGLTIVRRIIQAHGWTVTATDSRQGGARFEIRGVDIESG